MLTYEEILNYCSNYKIENGIVFDKRTNKQVLDEDIILKVKSSILLFREAHKLHEGDIFLNHKETMSKEECIKKAIRNYSVNGEKTGTGINNVINNIMDSNGHYESYLSGGNLENTKYEMFSKKNKEYGLAYLRLKFREKGLDVENLTVSLNEIMQSNKSTGQFKLIIDFKLKKYQKEGNMQLGKNELFQHPKARELNELEQKKQIAKQNGDQKSAIYYQNEIEKIVKENELSISPEEWDKLTDEQKISYYKIKMNESKVFKDEVSYNFWQSNLKSLQDKKEASHNSQNLNVNPSSQSFANQAVDNKTNEGQYKDFKYYYNEMIRVLKSYDPSINMTEEQKKHFIGEVFYNEMYMIENITNNKDIETLTTLVVNDLSKNELEIRLSNIIIAELQEKYKELNPQIQEVKNESIKPKEQINSSKEIDLSGLINELKTRLNQIKNAYHVMIKDGYIDDQELETLTFMISKVINDGYTLKSLATSQKDNDVIDSIIQILEEQQKKMISVQSGIKEIGRGL